MVLHTDSGIEYACTDRIGSKLQKRCPALLEKMQLGVESGIWAAISELKNFNIQKTIKNEWTDRLTVRILR